MSVCIIAGNVEAFMKARKQCSKVEPLYDAKLITKSRMSSVSRALLNAVLAAVLYGY